MWIPPIVLASAGLLAELVPGFSSAALVRPASSAVLGFADEVKLSLWHGFTPMLGLSVVTVLAGIGLFALQRTWRRLGERLARFARVGPAAAYEGALKGLVWVAKTQTRWIQSGVLRRYVTLILLTLVGLTSWGLIVNWRPALGLGDLGELTRLEAVAIELVAVVMILAGAIATLRSRSRLAAVALLGLVGFGVALLFFLFSGIDLAITQFAVETLAVLLFVFVLYKLPRFASLSSRWQRLLDATLAVAVGAVMTVLVLAVTRAPKSGALGSWLADNAVSSGKGRNVVNVILVDFRALDTLGEITVLTVAALGVHALLKLRPGRLADGPEEGA
jgi:multicomponent Na+:H+ antiporter subunit A